MNTDFINHKPLVVDLDGTLLQGDMLFESLLLFCKYNPLRFFLSLFWLLTRGKAYLKQRLAARAKIAVHALPYNLELLAFLRDEKKNGRKIILATASAKIYADEIASHLDLFHEVIASEDTNLSAHNKKQALIQRYQEKGFDYIGNSADDLVVWSSANRAIAVNPDFGIRKRVTKMANLDKVIHPKTSIIYSWIKALRLHQWLKNSLIFIPLLAAHLSFSPLVIIQALVAFLSFSLCASSAYLLNDLLDLESDRQHPRKKNRPFASGALSIKAGLVTVPLLFLIGFGLSYFLLSKLFLVVLLAYYSLTIAYSLYLKQIMMLDVVSLASLYTLRIVGGTYAFNLSLTFWMLAFSMFLFTSLAFVKRYTELQDARNKGKTDKMPGRGYYPSDLELISSLGGAAGYLSILVLALYIQDNSIAQLYHHPHIIWLSCPLLLFWISRIWLLTHRGQMHDDPVVFAATDKVSLLIGLLFAVIFWVAL